jgi:hypothetical protein
MMGICIENSWLIPMPGAGYAYALCSCRIGLEFDRLAHEHRKN